MELIPVSKKDLLKPIFLEPWQKDNSKTNLFCVSVKNKGNYLCYKELDKDKANILNYNEPEKDKTIYLCYNEPENDKRKVYASLEVDPIFDESDDPDVFKFVKCEQEMYFELRFCQDAIQIFKDFLSFSSEDSLPMLKNAVDALTSFCTNKNPGTIILNRKFGLHISRRQDVIN